MRFSAIFLILLSFFNAKSASAFQCVEVLNPLYLAEKALAEFSFPEEGNFPTRLEMGEELIKLALYIIYEGKDFYTGEKLKMNQMTIDHILPRSKGGPDNIFNYVPTALKSNEEKGVSFTREHFSALEEVRDNYGPRVMDFLRSIKARERYDQYLLGERLREIKSTEELEGFAAATGVRVEDYLDEINVRQVQLENNLRIFRIQETLAARRAAEKEEQERLRVEERFSLKRLPGIYVQFENLDSKFFNLISHIVIKLSNMTDSEIAEVSDEFVLSTAEINRSLHGDLVESARFQIFRVSERDPHRQEVDDISGSLLEVISYPLIEDVEAGEVRIELNLGFLDKLISISKMESTADQEQALLALFETTVLSPSEYMRW